MVNCGLAAGCKNSWLPGRRHHCSECKVMLDNLCVQSALKIEDMPDVWLCGTTYCHTRRSKKDGAAAGRAALAAAAGGGGSAGLAKKNARSSVTALATPRSLSPNVVFYFKPLQVVTTTHCTLLWLYLASGDHPLAYPRGVATDV